MHWLCGLPPVCGMRTYARLGARSRHRWECAWCQAAPMIPLMLTSTVGLLLAAALHPIGPLSIGDASLRSTAHHVLSSPSPAAARTCEPAMKLNKQQELARLMEIAERQKAGLPVDDDILKPKPKPKQAKPAPTKKLQSRDELFAAMKKLKDANPDSISGPSSAQRYGVTKKAAASASRASPTSKRAGAASNGPRRSPPLPPLTVLRPRPSTRTLTFSSCSRGRARRRARRGPSRTIG